MGTLVYAWLLVSAALFVVMQLGIADAVGWFTRDWLMVEGLLVIVALGWPVILAGTFLVYVAGVMTGIRIGRET